MKAFLENHPLNHSLFFESVRSPYPCEGGWGGMMHGHWGGMGSGWGIIGTILSFILVLAVIFALVAAGVFLLRHHRHSHH